jgi:hypothetical protein
VAHDHEVKEVAAQTEFARRGYHDDAGGSADRLVSGDRGEESAVER